MKKTLSRPSIWCFTTYFAEGMPYSVIRQISSLFFRDRNMSLQNIGLTSLFGIAWIIKFLWAPAVDTFATKRRWMLIMQAFLAAVFVLVALFSSLSNGVPLIAILFLIGSFVAATHDTAIDGYYMEALDKAGQAAYVGYRVMAYRIAMMFGTGVVATIGTTIGWLAGFGAAAVMLWLVWTYHLFFLPHAETARRSFRELLAAVMQLRVLIIAAVGAGCIWALRAAVRSPAYTNLGEQVAVFKTLGFSSWISLVLLAALVAVAVFRKKIFAAMTRKQDGFYSRAFLSFMDRDKIGILLAFIILLRTGEFMLSSMVSPFLVDMGMKVHYGWMSGFVGLPASIAGAMLGGWMISRFTLYKVLWPFLLAQNLTNLMYMGLALWAVPLLAANTGNAHPEGVTVFAVALTAMVHGFDQFAGGLGTAVLMTYLMRICNSEHKAAHYAIGSGLMSLSGVFAGVSSGFIAQWQGYAFLFGLSFVLSVPGMVLAFFVPRD